ncbi:MAG TPA: DedA family protein [Pirellulales bacterium]|jgi:membrane protein DedA with SNARE-associated domain|nr:DedA family protein [Pirellulales bacterium]
MVAELLTGYGGIMLVLFLTGCGLPVPEELPIVTAGALSWKGTLHWQIALPCTVLAALAGDSAIYWIGRHFGRAILKDHPSWVGFLTPEREKKAETLIRQHGMKLLFVIRFLPGLRLPVYLTTGILRMPFRKFLLTDAFCAFVVVGTFFGLGYAWGQEIMTAIQAVEHFLLYIVLGIAAIAGLIFYFKRRKYLANLKAHAEDAAPAALESDGARPAAPSLPPAGENGRAHDDSQTGQPRREPHSTH